MDKPQVQPAQNYFPHINGLRTLAILGVVFYHLHTRYCPAGYFGVDVFLVISGYLLFAGLLKPGAAERIKFGTFWLRKAWRILPSWFVLVAVVSTLSVFLMEYDRINTILRTARSTAYLTSDYYIDASGNYFNVFSQQNPFLHMWYLSITQQIYIFFPLLVIPLVRWCSRKLCFIVLALLSALSLAFWVLTNGVLSIETEEAVLKSIGMQSAYYHLIPRFWEVSAGALIFALPSLSERRLLRGLLALLGLAGVVASFYYYGTGSPHSYAAVIGTLLLLKYGDTGVCSRLLCWKPVQAIGTISFSLYLWHWPVMVFWKYICLDKVDACDEVGMLLLSFALAILSWYLLERIKAPTRQGWKGTLQRCALLLLLPVVMIGSTQVNHALKRHTYPYGHSMLQGYDRDAEALRAFPSDLLRYPLRTTGEDETIPHTFFVMGDSHAAHLFDGLVEACKKRHCRGVHLNNSVAPYWYYRLAPVKGDMIQWDEPLSEAVLHYLKEHPDIRYVLIAQSWEDRLMLPGTDWRDGKVLEAGEASRAYIARRLRDTCDRLRAIGKQVVLLADVPRFDAPSPRDEWNRCQRLGLEAPERSRSVEEHDNYNAFSHALLQEIAAEGRAIYIDPAVVLLRNGCYPARIDGDFVIGDTHHLTSAGSALVADYILEQLHQHEQQPPAP